MIYKNFQQRIRIFRGEFSTPFRKRFIYKGKTHIIQILNGIINYGK